MRYRPLVFCSPRSELHCNPVCLRGDGSFLPSEMFLTFLFQPTGTHPLAAWHLASGLPAVVQSWFSKVQIHQSVPWKGSPRGRGEGSRGTSPIRGSPRTHRAVLWALAWGRQDPSASSVGSETCLFHPPAWLRSPATWPSLLGLPRGCRLCIHCWFTWKAGRTVGPSVPRGFSPTPVLLMTPALSFPTGLNLRCLPPD